MPIRLNLSPGQSPGVNTAGLNANRKLRLLTIGGRGASGAATSAQDESLIASALAAAASVAPVKTHQLAKLVKEDPGAFYSSEKYDEDAVRDLLTKMHDAQRGKAEAPTVDAYTRRLARAAGGNATSVAAGVEALKKLPKAKQEAAAKELATYAVAVASEATRLRAAELGLNRERLELVREVSSGHDPELRADLESLKQAVTDLTARVAAIEKKK